MYPSKACASGPIGALAFAGGHINSISSSYRVECTPADRNLPVISAAEEAVISRPVSSRTPTPKRKRSSIQLQRSLADSRPDGSVLHLLVQPRCKQNPLGIKFRIRDTPSSCQVIQPANERKRDAIRQTCGIRLIQMPSHVLPKQWSCVCIKVWQCIWLCILLPKINPIGKHKHEERSIRRTLVCQQHVAQL